MKQHYVNLPIDSDAFDALVCARLRRSIKYIKADMDDPDEDRKLIDAMKRVLKYYGG
jgi:hypothetical protein